MTTLAQSVPPEKTAVPLSHLHRPAEVAQRLRTGRDQVMGLIHGGELRARKVAGTWRISERAVREYLGEPLDDDAPPPPPAALPPSLGTMAQLGADECDAIAEKLHRLAAAMRVEAAQRQAQEQPHHRPPLTALAGGKAARR